MNRRHMVIGAAAGLALPLAAWAQYPQKAVRILAGNAAGGPTDVVARLVAAGLSKELGHQVWVDNKPGASGVIAMDAMARSDPDGHTLMLAGVGDLAITPALRKKLPYDVARDVKPIRALASVHNVLVVTPGSGIKSLQDFLGRAKAAPGKVSFGSAGPGTVSHVLPLMLSDVAGVQLMHIPYKGAAPAMNDLVGGHVDCVFLGMPVAVSAVASGKVRALAVTGSSRSATLPDVPSFAEAGIVSPDFNEGFWWALIGPAKLPAEAADRLSQAWEAALKRPDIQEQLKRQGLDPRPESGAALEALVDRERKKWARVIKSAGITAD